MIPARVDERHVLPLAMFFGSFAWSFVYIGLPFHIQRISTWDAAGTPLVTVARAPLWGRSAERRNPKTLYALVQVPQRLAFLGSAAACTLVVGAGILFGCGALVRWGIPDPAEPGATPYRERGRP